MPQRSFDIIISGAGPVGLATALAARRTLGPRARILVCDPQLNSPRHSLLAYAVSPASKNLLQNIGAWSRLAELQPITRMEITDSALRDAVRQNFLNFDARPQSNEALATMVGHDDLTAALLETAREADISFRQDTIIGLAKREASVEAVFKEGPSLTAGLLAACDGAKSTLRELEKIPVTGWDYDRRAIVATVRAERDHAGTAVQHFLPAGTFALLPLTGSRFSVVWVEKPDDAAALCSTMIADFEFELQQRAGHAFGRLSLLDGPQSYPLRLQIAQRFHGDRVVLLGDAAHTTHPLAGQGLNLGLHDVAYLMQQLAGSARLGIDIGTLDSLKAYETSRRLETVATLGAADALFRLFSLPGVPAKALRAAGLGIVDRSQGFKSIFVRLAAGNQQGQPKLLRAEPVDI